MKASFYLCLAGGLLGLRCTSVEISRCRCSNVRCLFGTMALGGVAFAAFIWLAPNKAYHNMAGLRFNTVQRPVIIASLLLKWLSICKNEFSHMWSQTVLLTVNIQAWARQRLSGALWQHLWNEINKTERHFALMCPSSPKHLQRSFSWQTQPAASIILSCPGTNINSCKKCRAFNCFYSKAFASNPFPVVREQFT